MLAAQVESANIPVDCKFASVSKFEFNDGSIGYFVYYLSCLSKNVRAAVDGIRFVILGRSLHIKKCFCANVDILKT